MNSLEGKAIYLTGASRGIGRALALRCAKDRAALVLCGRDRKALDGLGKEVKALGASRVHLKAFDLAEERAILQFLEEAREAVGPPEILINNAGFNPRKALLTDVTTEEFDAILAVNLRAPFILAREALRDMVRSGKGHIVNVLSTVCHFANETMGAYTAAKKGLEGLAGVLLKEARAHGVRVSSIYPGGTDTTFRASRRADYMKAESVAEAIHAVLTLPEDVVTHAFTFRPMVETNF
ncbi:MAG TPA: SDR family oxidoreductase [Planctomycetota bacterium]|nr:SDR family oxidoreductase [Planctomycetota bacterium]